MSNITFEPIETIIDNNGFACVIVETNRYNSLGQYMVRYLDSKRWWLNSKTGYPYFKSITACRSKIRAN